MSSIPGLPTPGSEVPVLINKVNLKSRHGLVELWVSVDDGRKHIYEQKREEIQIPQRKFYGSEGKPGDTCLVCVTDVWHRAQIVSIQNETYNVFLIDQGESHVTTSAALAWGKNDSFQFPPKIELCILANVISLQNEWPETVTKFLMCLPGKRFKGLVRYIIKPDRIILLEMPIISKHMCKLGAAKKIKVDEFLEVVQRHLCESGKSSGSLCLPQELELDIRCQLPHHDQYFYPELTTNIYETVKVTEVFDPLNISCIPFVFSKAVELLSDQIHQHYEESSDFREAHPQSCGDPCATRGADGRWHRSLLKQNVVNGEDVVEVFHVDEGKPELVEAEGIRPLLGRFLKMPVFTYHCSLSGVKANLKKWTADETDEVKSMLLDKTLVARIEDYDKPQDVYYVALYGANAECINDVILEKAGLVSSSESGKGLNDQKESSSSLSLEEKKLLNLQNQTNGVCDLEEKTRPNATEQVDSGRSGCSQVLDPLLHSNGHLSTSLLQNACDDSTFAVGETVDVQISCIESLQKIWGQPLKSGDSLSVCKKAFKNIDLLTDPKKSNGKTEMVYASCIAGPSFFWCQFSNTEDLDKVSQLAHKAGQEKQDAMIPKSLNIGGPCLALFSQDNQWYRAQILQKDEETLRVLFVDYGNEAEVDVRNVRPLPQSLLETTSQAFLCSLSGFDESKGCWTDEAYDNFYNVLINKPLKLTIHTMRDHPEITVPQYSVDVDHEGVNINAVMLKYWEPVTEDMAKPENPSTTDSIQDDQEQSSMKQLCESKEASNKMDFKDLMISRKITETVYASCIAEPDFFWCQFSNTTDDLHKVSQLAQEFGQEDQDVMFPQSLESGSPCLALFSQDDQWYRAQVMQKEGETLRVLFVDYGNEAEVDIKNVRALPKSLMEMSPQAFLCRLSGFEKSKGSWDDTAYDEFYKLLVDKPLKVTVLDMEEHSEMEIPQYEVQMECEGVVVNTLMKKYWRPLDVEGQFAWKQWPKMKPNSS
nr:tudor domain-containing 6 [Nothobranchius furzeri]